MLQMKTIIVLRPRSLPRPLQIPPIRPLGPHLRRDLEEHEVVFLPHDVPRPISFGHDRSGILRWPYTPVTFSSMYSRIFSRTSGGSCGAANMRLMTAAERPEVLWFPLRIVQVVLRQSPIAWACSSSVTKPAVTRASPSSLSLDDCRAFVISIFSCQDRPPRLLTGSITDSRMQLR